MAKCANLNREPRDVVEATTDIAGPGVVSVLINTALDLTHEQALYAYFVSAILAILAIVYGYLSDSLPESYLNETDRTVLASFQACLPSEKNAARM
ncbi:hypothetical protein BU25DRAFT_29232 [Macroventuria anomochaeta]|uniref:Uncharacterized protein n=1 Tax=Macroventuria anomochaeta TaxID=301207 RepID=A0ACB6S3V1_9PLEO|nr:uncharacterized protein BU25DRAFT_29232 [Macroventuria anomochaeta]KAF2628652.1 hypothetical protein BU25DRAFT_29232 [Macroventuria anomochaeta]